MATLNRATLFQIGDRVRVPYGQRKLTGTIIEDRGNIGYRGRRLFQVEIPLDPFEPMIMELPENDIEVIPSGAVIPAHLEKEKCIQYLVNGGLLAILSAGSAIEKSVPQVWLCLDQLGNITHTFFETRGIVGGQAIPVMSVYDSKIFVPKRELVAKFLQSFGLTVQEADTVIQKVGTAPLTMSK